MKVKQIMEWSDWYTDEVQMGQQALGYANNAIARINTAFGTELPFIETIEEDYTALNANWFVRFVQAQLSYGIKMNDGALTEAREYKEAFEMALYDFGSVDRESAIDEAYWGKGFEQYQIDTTNTIDMGWFGGER